MAVNDGVATEQPLPPAVAEYIKAQDWLYGYQMNAPTYRANLETMARFAIEQDRLLRSAVATEKPALACWPSYETAKRDFTFHELWAFGNNQLLDAEASVSPLAVTERIPLGDTATAIYATPFSGGSNPQTETPRINAVAPVDAFVTDSDHWAVSKTDYDCLLDEALAVERDLGNARQALREQAQEIVELRVRLRPTSAKPDILVSAEREAERIERALRSTVATDNQALAGYLRAIYASRENIVGGFSLLRLSVNSMQMILDAAAALESLPSATADSQPGRFVPLLVKGDMPEKQAAWDAFYKVAKGAIPHNADGTHDGAFWVAVMEALNAYIHAADSRRSTDEA